MSVTEVEPTETGGEGDAVEDNAVLPLPPEPVDLRERLRSALLAGADWSGEFGDELGIGDVLWEAWGVRLQSEGMERAAFAETIGGYRREIWFWLLGDRIWAQMAAGLAGRLLRRLPTT